MKTDSIVRWKVIAIFQVALAFPTMEHCCAVPVARHTTTTQDPAIESTC